MAPSRWGFRAKLFVVSIGVILLAVVCADVYLSGALDGEWTARMRRDLLVRLALVESRVALMTAPLDDLRAWDALADELGDRADVRVTVIRGDGKVIGDSEVALADFGSVENHAARPEVAQALRGRHGSGARLSATVGQRMIYEAEPLRRDGQVVGVVRVAMPLAEVDRAIVKLHKVLATGSLLALALALLISSVVAHVMTRGLREVTQTTRRMARGDLDARVRVDTHDELSELGRTLNGLVADLSGTMRDLRAERDRLGGILEAMEEGVLLADRSHRIVLANTALHALLSHGEPGYAADPPPPAEMVGRSIIEVVRNSELGAIVDRTLTTQEPVSGEIEIGAVRARRLLVHAAPLSGPPAGCVVVFVDVTEIRRLEGIRREFVANVSHELRTPVTALRTGIETARQVLRKEPGGADRFLEMAERNADRLVNLVNDLLDLSRIESGQFKLEPERLVLDPVVAQVMSLFRASAERRGMRLQSRIPADLPPARADRQALEHVLANLVDNGVKYSREGTELTVSARAEGSWVLLSVADQGPGIEAKHLPRLFERFYRVDAGRSRDRGGTGLGLAIVKHLSEAMGGKVEVDSTLGKGATFTVTLPVA